MVTAVCSAHRMDEHLLWHAAAQPSRGQPGGKMSSVSVKLKWLGMASTIHLNS